MSEYMYISIVPMIGFLLAMGLYGERYLKRLPQIISIALAVMCLSLTEMTLLCSFPHPKQKATEVQPTIEINNKL
jgi:hypothetical protein